jgi:hypothetical protein
MWKPDRLLKTILVLTMLTMIVVWLPFIRGLLDGETYEWGASFWGFQFGGRGASGDYWILIFQAIFGISLLYFGWRGARQPFHWLLLIWTIPSFIDAIYNALRFPENYRFRGDTLGVDVSLAWVGPLFFGGLAALSVIWVIRDLRQRQTREVPAWNRANSILLALTIGLLPVQFGLLRFGEPHGTTDQIGVLLTIAQWLILNMSFAPRERKAAVGVRTA